MEEPVAEEDEGTDIEGADSYHVDLGGSYSSYNEIDHHLERSDDSTIRTYSTDAVEFVSGLKGISERIQTSIEFNTLDYENDNKPRRYTTSSLYSKYVQNSVHSHQPIAITSCPAPTGSQPCFRL